MIANLPPETNRRFIFDIFEKDLQKYFKLFHSPLHFDLKVEMTANSSSKVYVKKTEVPYYSAGTFDCSAGNSASCDNTNGLSDESGIYYFLIHSNK